MDCDQMADISTGTNSLFGAQSRWSSQLHVTASDDQPQHEMSEIMNTGNAEVTTQSQECQVKTGHTPPCEASTEQPEDILLSENTLHQLNTINSAQSDETTPRKHDITSKLKTKLTLSKKKTLSKKLRKMGRYLKLGKGTQHVKTLAFI